MTANETFRNATRDGGFKHGAKKIAVAKLAMAVF